MPRTSIEYEQAQQKRIVEGAARVFAENGYRLTTIDQIAQALQLSKGAVYIYFKSKEELYVAALAAIYERRFTILSTAYSENDRILVRFEKISRSPCKPRRPRRLRISPFVVGGVSGERSYTQLASDKSRIVQTFLRAPARLASGRATQR